MIVNRLYTVKVLLNCPEMFLTRENPRGLNRMESNAVKSIQTR